MDGHVMHAVFAGPLFALRSRLFTKSLAIKALSASNMCPPMPSLRLSSEEPETTVQLPMSILIHFPDDQMSLAVLKHAQSNLHPSILAHSIRVYLYARALGTHIGSSWCRNERWPLLFAACLFHDISTSATHESTNQRFEVEAADFASTFLASHGQNAADCHEVWVAIACHTSPGIAERISSLANLVRIGVTVDFGVLPEDADDWMLSKEELERILPREEIEHVLTEAVLAHCANDIEHKAPKSSWPWSLHIAKEQDPDWKGINKGF